MGSHGGGRAIRTLVAILALLLPAGAWAVVGVDTEPPTTVVAGGRAGATGLGAATPLDEDAAPAPVPTFSAVPPSVPTAAAPATTEAKPRIRSSTTTTPPAPRTTATLPPGVPWPNLPPPTGLPDIAPATSWQIVHAGMSARLWIEPAAPAAGQPVRFHIDYSSAEPCCALMLDFGDGSAGYSSNSLRMCGDPSALTPGSHSAVTTHTYTSAGVYKAMLTLAKDTCVQLPGASPSLPTPQPDAVSTPACIAVGPGTSQKGCSPFPPFAPGSLVPPTAR